jgi:hypothetical protein
MREIRLSGSEGGAAQSNASLLPLSRGDVNESVLRVEASLEEQAVPMGMEPAIGSRALEHDGRGGAEGRAGGLRHQVVYKTSA